LYLGDAAEVTVEDLVKASQALLSDLTQLEAMHNRCKQLIDCKGAKRVAEAVLSVIEE
jgi:UDP-N-acetylglucosamine:LPS N-acetylglucosamine transferase